MSAAILTMDKLGNLIKEFSIPEMELSTLSILKEVRNRGRLGVGASLRVSTGVSTCARACAPGSVDRISYVRSHLCAGQQAAPQNCQAPVPHSGSDGV